MSILVEGFFKKEKIILELEALSIGRNEKEKILMIVDEIAELKLLDAVLEKLESKDKELFMEQLHGGSVQIVAQILREKIENIEDVLEERAKILEDEIIDDIRNLRQEKI